MFQDIAIEELSALRQTGSIVTIDVRSPSEYADATIPGSLNIPLFNDEERAEIGTIYKQVSVHAAKERGLEIASAKLPAFIKAFSQIPGKKAVFCWRGGMRSKTSATVLDLMGIRIYRIEGGYRAYRQWVVSRMDEFELAPLAYVLHGNTGTGKTAILRKLQEQSYPVLDIERLAGHRGSIFGNIGLISHNQKTFDAQLSDELIRLESVPYFLMEAESKRVGKIVLPGGLVKKKEEGKHIWLELPLEARVTNLLEEYKPWEHQEACIQSFRLIKSRMHTPIAAEIEWALKHEEYRMAIELLLVHYYDQRYSHSNSAYELDDRIVIKAASVDEAVVEIQQLLGGGTANE
ncbi:tRNA 2-selenouridine(34) synthase MnmH [Paenibacillus sp. OV219]|uniref:tRNA 2-selenouridine(34) synthase MnmH n=1 Tax=Paenibacillus sp. OV219 TaxID=1884377 RepID=UPI0008BF8473|nr:tRNA 2-selenouridine(34) synthase MnmH [Paenibacillus sp. OV219]SEO94512.1 tRNA 2-selenouridine synthase [Paenibacillus sp. OV219]